MKQGEDCSVKRGKAVRPKKIVLRGYVRPKNDYFLAVCIDLNLIAQGKTVKEAVISLGDAIDGYLEELNENPKFYKDAFPRRSPTSFYVEYYWACVVTYWRSFKWALGNIFKTNNIKKVYHSWAKEQYPVNFTGLQRV